MYVSVLCLLVALKLYLVISNNYILDPFCGVGTIPIHVASYYPHIISLGTILSMQFYSRLLTLNYQVPIWMLSVLKSQWQMWRDGNHQRRTKGSQSLLSRSCGGTHGLFQWETHQWMSSYRICPLAFDLVRCEWVLQACYVHTIDLYPTLYQSLP